MSMHVECLKLEKLEKLETNMCVDLKMGQKSTTWRLPYTGTNQIQANLYIYLYISSRSWERIGIQPTPRPHSHVTSAFVSPSSTTASMFLSPASEGWGKVIFSVCSHLRGGGGGRGSIPIRLTDNLTPCPGQNWMGVPSPPPLVGTGWGTLPSSGDREACYAAGGMPLAFTQEDPLFFVVFLVIGTTEVLFVGLLILLFWTYGEVCPGFQKHGGGGGGIPCLHVLSPACNEFVRVISGTTPADLLVARIAAQSFQSTYLQILYPQVLVGIWTDDEEVHSTMLLTIWPPWLG